MQHPSVNNDTTVLLDLASSMSSPLGDSTRLSAATAALRQQLPNVTDASAIGLWHYGKTQGGAAPYQVDVKTGPLTTTNRNQLATALGGVEPTGTGPDNTYPTLEAAYREAVTGYVDGRTNSILLITDGPDGPTSETDEKLLTAIAATTNPSKPVHIDVIVVGDGPGAAALQTVAQRTGGTFTKAANPDDLTKAVQHAFS